MQDKDNNNINEEQEQWMVDSHTHLLDYTINDSSIMKKVLENCKKYKIKYIMNTSIDENDFQQMIKQNEEINKKNEFTEIIMNFGLHPCFLQGLEVQENYDFEKTIPELLEKYPNAHVGEIGLDFKIKDKIPKKVQTTIFEKQLQIALNFNRTVSIHSVRAQGDVLKILKKQFKKLENEEQHINVILHSYGGNADMTKGFLKLNSKKIFFSISMLCLKRPDIIEAIPLENLLTETDAPYQIYEEYVMEDEQFKSQIQKGIIRHDQENQELQSLNEPCFIELMFPVLSKIYKKSQQEIKQQIYQNFLNALNINNKK